jgi:neutral ceramidase
MLRLSLVVAAVALGPPAVAQNVPQIKAGAFAQDVTPTKFPISVNGGFSDRQATSAADPLHARCLVLDDGSTKLAFVVVDSCMMPRELVDAAKELASQKTGIPTTNMMISATHTHTAPTVTGVFQSDPDAGYVKFLAEKIAEGIEKANARLAPAKVGWGVAEEPRQVFNRRWKMKDGVVNKDPFGGTGDRVRMNPGVQNPDLLDPAGPTDPAVSVLSVRDTSDKPVSLMANYSLHYVGGVPALSADYFGAFANAIGPKLGASGDGFVGILSNGTSGDVNNINFREPAPKRMPGEQARLVAEAVADAAKKAADGAAYNRFVILRAAEKELELGVRKPTADEVKRAQGILDGVKGRELRGAEEVYARETVLIAKYPDTVKLKVQVLTVSELAVVAIPCEVFTDIGLGVKRRSPFKPTFVVSLANGYNGYLPTPAHHALGGYETWRARSSYLEVKASEKIEAAVSELFGGLARGK